MDRPRYGADLMDLKTIHMDDLFGYDAIVFCGGCTREEYWGSRY
jgi:hypothetical protein